MRFSLSGITAIALLGITTGAVGCNQAKAFGGADKVPECADYLKVLDACDAKQGGPAKGVEQRVFRKNWVNDVTHRSVSDLAAECAKNAAEKRKECGVP